MAVRFMTNEGEFGILLAKSSAGTAEANPATCRFRFQLLLDGHLIGDEEPCIPGSAFGHLRKPFRIDPAQWPDLPAEPERMYAYLDADATLHEQTRAPQAQSLEGWSTKQFVTGSRVVLLARENRGEKSAAGPVHGCAVGIDA